MRVLIVIDCQEEFLAQISNPWPTLDAIIEEAPKYDKVIVVEYTNSGETDDDISRIADYFVEKDENDGADALKDLLKSLKPTEICLAGLYFEFCVSETAWGLKNLGYDPIILGDLCIPQCDAEVYTERSPEISQFSKLNVLSIPCGWEEVFN